MRIRTSLFVAVLCMLALSSPAWAKNLSFHTRFNHLTKIATASLKPGQYRLVADESTGRMNVVRYGKVVAQVKGQWVNLKKKSQYSEVMSNRYHVQEVRFAGHSRALKFPG